MYASSRAFVCKFGKQLFNGTSSNISELCQEVIKHMNFTTDSTRKQSAALLYLLMKKNFEADGNSFTRVKVQTTISLSKLVGKGIKTDKYLRRSLATISKYVVQEFPPKVKIISFCIKQDSEWQCIRERFRKTS